MNARVVQEPRVIAHPLVFSAIALLLMLALRGWLQWVGPLPFDHFAVDRFGRHGLPVAVVNLFSGGEFRLIVVVTMVLGTVISWRLAGRAAAAGFVLSALVVLWNALLKILFGPVPFWAHGRAGIDYPSGHMSWTTAMLGYVTWIGIGRRRYCLACICLALILATGVERVMSGAHTVSDLLGGSLLAVAWLAITISYVAEGGVRDLLVGAQLSQGADALGGDGSIPSSPAGRYDR